MNMNMIEKLTTNIAKLFHEKGIRYEYEPDVIDDMLQHIDFGFLFNAITQAAQPVYCYSVDSDMPMTLKYCGPKMFPGNATRIYSDISTTANIYVHQEFTSKINSANAILQLLPMDKKESEQA